MGQEKPPPIFLYESKDDALNAAWKPYGQKMHLKQSTMNDFNNNGERFNRTTTFDGGTEIRVTGSGDPFVSDVIRINAKSEPPQAEAPATLEGVERHVADIKAPDQLKGIDPRRQDAISVNIRTDDVKTELSIFNKAYGFAVRAGSISQSVLDQYGNSDIGGPYPEYVLFFSETGELLATVDWDSLDYRAWDDAVADVNEEGTATEANIDENQIWHYFGAYKFSLCPEVDAIAERSEEYAGMYLVSRDDSQVKGGFLNSPIAPSFMTAHVSNGTIDYVNALINGPDEPLRGYYFWSKYGGYNQRLCVSGGGGSGGMVGALGCGYYVDTNGTAVSYNPGYGPEWLYVDYIICATLTGGFAIESEPLALSDYRDAPIYGIEIESGLWIDTYDCGLMIEYEKTDKQVYNNNSLKFPSI